MQLSFLCLNSDNDTLAPRYHCYDAESHTQLYHNWTLSLYRYLTVKFLKKHWTSVNFHGLRKGIVSTRYCPAYAWVSRREYRRRLEVRQDCCCLEFLQFSLSATVRINHKTRLCVLSMTSSDLEVTPVNICHGVSGVQLVGAKKSAFKCLSPSSWGSGFGFLRLKSTRSWTWSTREVPVQLTTWSTKEEKVPRTTRLRWFIQVVP